MKKIYSLEIDIPMFSEKEEISEADIQAFKILAKKLHLRCKELTFDTISEKA